MSFDSYLDLLEGFCHACARPIDQDRRYCAECAADIAERMRELQRGE